MKPDDQVGAKVLPFRRPADALRRNGTTVLGIHGHIDHAGERYGFHLEMAAHWIRMWRLPVIESPKPIPSDVSDWIAEQVSRLYRANGGFE